MFRTDPFNQVMILLLSMLLNNDVMSLNDAYARCPCLSYAFCALSSLAITFTSLSCLLFECPLAGPFTLIDASSDCIAACIGPKHLEICWIEVGVTFARTDLMDSLTRLY